jgi:hypothetical protein
MGKIKDTEKKPKSKTVRKILKKKVKKTKVSDKFVYNGVKFPEGNRFWQQRSKHGRDKLFATPQLMLDAACEYFEWCSNNPLNKIDFKGKDAEMVNIPLMRPFTWEGLTNYLCCNTLYFNDFKKSLAGKTDEMSNDFSIVTDWISSKISQQKYEGAVVGLFNPTIIARDLGLKEQTDVSSSDGSLNSNIAINFESLFPDAKKDEV